MKEEHEYKSEPTEEDRYDITAYKSPYNYLLANIAIGQTETIEPSPRMRNRFMDVDQDVTDINTELLGEGEYDLVIFENIPWQCSFKQRAIWCALKLLRSGGKIVKPGYPNLLTDQDLCVRGFADTPPGDKDFLTYLESVVKLF